MPAPTAQLGSVVAAANPSLGGLPFQPVNEKSVSTVPVTAGDSYAVGLSCVDTSASADDPSA